MVKPGGVIDVDGRTVSSSEADFPPFPIGEEYILFLRFDPQQKTYIVPYGAQGAFRLVAGFAEQVSREGKIKAERGVLPYAALAQEIRELAGRR